MILFNIYLNLFKISLNFTIFIFKGVLREFEADCEATETLNRKVLKKSKFKSGNVIQEQESSSTNIKEKDK